MAENSAIYNLTAPVVMSFPNLFEARAFGPKGKESGTPKFSANLNFKADSEDLKGLKALAVKVARARWPERSLKELKFPFSDGDKLADKAKEKKKDGEFQRGHVVVAGRSKYEPRLAVFENGKIVDLEGAARAAAKGKFYPGVEVLVTLCFVAYDGVGANPDGVTAYLNLVLTTNKGKRIAGGASAAETFKGYAGSASAEDPTAGQSSDLDDEVPF